MHTHETQSRRESCVFSFNHLILLLLLFLSLLFLSLLLLSSLLILLLLLLLLFLNGMDFDLNKREFRDAVRLRYMAGRYPIISQYAFQGAYVYGGTRDYLPAERLSYLAP